MVNMGANPQALTEHGHQSIDSETALCDQSQFIDLKAQVERDRLLAKATRQICRSLDVEEILNATVSEVRQLLAVERVILYRFASDWTGTVVVESVDQHWPSMLGKEVYDPCFVKHWIKAYTRGRVQATEDIYASGLSQCHIDFLAQFNIRANLVVPILQSSSKGNQQPRLWGLLSVQHCSATRVWKTSDIDFLQKLAIHVELALQKAELYEKTQTELRERQQAQAEILRLNADLEQRVIDRTTQLAVANHSLLIEIAERKSIESSLFAEKELAQITLQSIGDAVITTDAKGDIQYFNPVAEKLTGWKLHEVKGIPLANVFNIVNEITRRTVENPLHQVLRTGQIVALANNTVLIARDGTEYPIEDSAAPIRACNGEIIGVVLVFHDVTQSRSLARQLAWQANHDSLSGLFNRSAFERQLNDAIIGAKSQNEHHVLCYLDLDQFKVVNDTCGHAAGDDLLRQVTKLLQERVRLTDTLARLGGDEFGLLLHQCSLAHAEKVAESLRQLIQDFRFTWQEKVFTIGVSIGLVQVDANCENLNTVLSAADSACYAAKGKGRNCIYVYQANDQELERQRTERQWVSRIEQALREDRFSLYAQKIVSLNHEPEIQHYEILLRLVDEAGSLVLPSAFIPAAERYQLMRDVDRWVIRNFFASFHAKIQKTGRSKQVPEDSLYTINLSGGSLNDGFLEFIQEILIEYQVPPQIICFEITETAAIANLELASHFIHSLKSLGCQFALDDFGSGMSSLTYLKNLPVDYLKIDGSFVKDMDHDKMDYAMVECFNHLSHYMGIQTIAEWVENDKVLQILRAMGVDYAQGYYIERPSPLAFANSGMQKSVVQDAKYQKTRKKQSKTRCS
jgi:diguanylate cyclase (GGDEF)-like protein/PAS domain S-box-containing protein